MHIQRIYFMNNKEFNPLKEMPFMIARTHRTMLNTLNQRLVEKGLDITSEQAVIIMRLGIADGMTQQELADAVFKEKSSVKRLIDNLIRKSLIVRIIDQNDKRSKRIYLTHSGKELREKMTLIAISVLQKVYQNIDNQEMETCKKVLTQIFNNLNNQNEK